MRWSLALLAIGALWRLLRFALCMPVWGDEAYLALNVMNRNFGELTAPLDYMQVAPLGFLVAEWSIGQLLGFSEYALRLLPLIAGLAAILFYWEWCRRLVSGRVVALAVGFVVLGYYPVRHATEIKPYAFDQLASIALLLLASSLLDPTSNRRRWTLFAGALVVGIVCSYPTIFTAGGCLLALAVQTIVGKRHRDWIPLLACGLAAACAFGASYLLVVGGQNAHTGGPMREYWRDAFPPASVWPALKWLISTHTGNMFAYPMGGKNGGSTITFVLFCAGVGAFWRARSVATRWLLLTPFALTFIAAAMHRYPYGGSARVAQHLAPIIGLCAATGLDAIIVRFCRSERTRRNVVVGTLAGFAILAVVGLVRDIVAPYKAPTDQKARAVVREIQAKARDEHSLIAVAQPMHQVPVNQQYYLRIGKGPVAWDARRTVDWTKPRGPSVIWLNFDPQTRHVSPPIARNAGWTLNAERIETIRLDPVMIPFWQIQYWRGNDS